ncbi:MAG: DNA repair protein RecO [Chlorobi bacterium]|nr:DNA repair protein RecO [Chlorobiota bacterium]
MLEKTRGIVFRKIKYSESSLILQVYTEKFGLQSLMARGTRSRKSKLKAGLFQHLALLDLVIYRNEKKDIHHIKEVKPAYSFSSIPFDIRKSSLVVFMNEVLLKSIKEEEENEGLFRFLFNSIQILDIKKEGIAEFHLLFLVLLSKFLGFFPDKDFSEDRPSFDLQEGKFIKSSESSDLLMPMPFSQYLFRFLSLNYDSEENLKLPGNLKNGFLDYLLKYYRIHLPGFGELKSHIILREVLG